MMTTLKDVKKRAKRDSMGSLMDRLSTLLRHYDLPLESLWIDDEYRKDDGNEEDRDGVPYVIANLGRRGIVNVYPGGVPGRLTPNFIGYASGKNKIETVMDKAYNHYLDVLNDPTLSRKPHCHLIFTDTWNPAIAAKYEKFLYYALTQNTQDEWIIVLETDYGFEIIPYISRGVIDRYYP